MTEQIKFKKNDDKKSLPESIDTGTLYFTYRDKDENNPYVKSGQLYLDADSTNRLQISGTGYDAGNAAEIFNDYRIRVDNDSGRKGNVATGYYSTASGLATTAEGTAAFAVGSGTTAEGEASFAGGKNSYVNGNFAAGFGQNTQVSGDGSFGIGDGTRAIGDRSFAGGQSADYIALKVVKSLGNNQYQIANLDGKSNYLDDSNNLTNLGKLSIGNVVLQANAENGGRGSIAIVANKEKNENDECIITLKNQDPSLTSWTFTEDPFQFAPGGSYSKNSFSFGENCTAAGENSISGGNGINVWGSNAIGWGSAETWNIEGDKLACQNRINEYARQIEEYRQAYEDATNPIIKAYNFSQYTAALFNKQGAESRLQKLNLYEVYEGVGNNSAVFGLNNSSLADGSLVAGKFNKSQGNNSLVVGEGNIVYYPDMTILGSFAKVDYLPNGLLNYDYVTKTGTNNHTKVETYSFPQLLIGNGGLDGGDSNSLEVYKNGLVRASKSFRVLDRGEIDQFSETVDTTTYTGLRLVAFNSLLFLDSGSYVCPPPSKNGLLHLGAPLAKWNTIYTENILVNKYYYSKTNTARAISIDECAFSSSLIYPMIQGFGGPDHKMLALDGGTSTMSHDIHIVPNPKRTGIKHLGHGDGSNALRWKLFSSAINNSGNISMGGNLTFSTIHGQIGTTKNAINAVEKASSSIHPTLYMSVSEDNGNHKSYARLLLTEDGNNSCLQPLYHYNDGTEDDAKDGEKTQYISLGSKLRFWKAAYINQYLDANGKGFTLGTSSLTVSGTTYKYPTIKGIGGPNHQFLALDGASVDTSNKETTNIFIIPNPNRTGNKNFGYDNAKTRWTNIYSVNAVNTSSDIRIKDIKSTTIMEKLLKMYEGLTPIAYTLKNLTEYDNHDRTHVGLSSQEVELKLIENELTALDFGGFCKDPVYKKDTTEIIDYNYSLRYGEFHGLHMMKNHQQDARLAELETKNQELENTISNLKTQMELLRLAVGG